MALRPGADDYKQIPSSTSKYFDVSKREQNRYSGDKLLGISTMHKSNAIPVTKGSDMAVATAKMRRG